MTARREERILDRLGPAADLVSDEPEAGSDLSRYVGQRLQPQRPGERKDGRTRCEPASCTPWTSLTKLCVGDLVLVLDASPDAVGYALRMLRTAGLVVNRRAGRVIYYRLADDFPAPLWKHWPWLGPGAQDSHRRCPGRRHGVDPHHGDRRQAVMLAVPGAVKAGLGISCGPSS